MQSWWHQWPPGFIIESDKLEYDITGGGWSMDEDRMTGEGWKLASTTSGADLRRILDMYQELGIEVYTEEVNLEECDGCTECFVAGGEPLYRIYTRDKDEAGDLF
jgi:hypothetical protein